MCIATVRCTAVVICVGTCVPVPVAVTTTIIPYVEILLASCVMTAIAFSIARSRGWISGGTMVASGHCRVTTRRARGSKWHAKRLLPVLRREPHVPGAERAGAAAGVRVCITSFRSMESRRRHPRSIGFACVFRASVVVAVCESALSCTLRTSIALCMRKVACMATLLATSPLPEHRLQPRAVRPAAAALVVINAIMMLVRLGLIVRCATLIGIYDRTLEACSCRVLGMFVAVHVAVILLALSIICVVVLPRLSKRR